MNKHTTGYKHNRQAKTRRTKTTKVLLMMNRGFGWALTIAGFIIAAPFIADFLK